MKQAQGEDGRGVIRVKEEINMIIGYAQVSTVEQALDLQKEALEQRAIDRLFTDVASTAKAKRPQLTLALSQLRAGDTFVVWKLDSLGLRVGRLIDTIEELTRRGIRFRSLTEGIDTTATSTGEPRPTCLPPWPSLSVTSPQNGPAALVRREGQPKAAAEAGDSSLRSKSEPWRSRSIKTRATRLPTSAKGLASAGGRSTGISPREARKKARIKPTAKTSEA